MANAWIVLEAGGYSVGVGRVGWKCAGVNSVYIGRPSRYGNPWSVEKFGRSGCIEKFERETLPTLDLKELVEILKRDGKLALLCFCAPLPCHGEAIAQRVLDLVVEEFLSTCPSPPSA